MRLLLATTCIVTGALLTGGCATKKYVRNTTTPIQAKVDQVGEQATHNTQQIDDTRNQVKQVDEKAQSGISAAQERASTADQHAATADQHAATADQHASDAMGRANQAAEAGEQNSQALNSLRQVVSNIDDYRLQTTVTVPFTFDKYALNPEGRQELDKLANDVQADKRFFVAVEGYTDTTGSKQYNEVLSRRRADAVVEYLVAKHDIPIYRIHMIGLGEEKPLDEAKNRAARAKNRRVEVKVFSADQATASLSGVAGSASRMERPDPATPGSVNK
jgi:outer membrane protein OmpA-like peptidoglycan-associated protein